MANHAWNLGDEKDMLLCVTPLSSITVSLVSNSKGSTAVQNGNCYWSSDLCIIYYAAPFNTECNCASSILGRCRNNDCDISCAHDLCNNASCYMATSTMVVKEEIILRVCT